MKNKHELVIAVTFFLIGAIGIFLVMSVFIYGIETRRLQSQELWRKILSIDDRLFAFQDSAIKEVITCSNEPNCDKAASIERYRTINKEYNNLGEEKQKLVDQLEQMSKN